MFTGHCWMVSNKIAEQLLSLLFGLVWFDMLNLEMVFWSFYVTSLICCNKFLFENKFASL